MIENRLRLWWKSFWSEEIRSAKAAVSQHFSEVHKEFQLLTVELVRFDQRKLVFLVFYRRNLPSRPTPFIAYEFIKGTSTIAELPESEGEGYRPNAYK